MLSCGQLLLAALPVALAIDFDMSCPQSTAFIGSTANITGTIPFPGIKQTNKTLTTDDDEKNQWSITETVFRNSIDFTTTGNSFVNIPFNTSMEKNTTNPHELPYVTCIWTMYFWPDPKGDGATDDDGSCRTIFGSACLDDLQNQYEDLAANYTISEHNSTSPCADFWRITGKKPLPKSCDGPIKNNNQVPSESAGFEPSSKFLTSPQT